MAFLEFENTKIYYEVFGNAQNWVTLVNGHTRSSRDFRSFARFLETKGYSTLIFDNRGSGQTTSNDFTIEDTQQDFIRLFQHLKIQKTHLLGISYGGILCQSFALHYPEYLKSLALVSTTPDSKYVTTGQSFAEIQEEAIAGYFTKYFSKRFLEKNPLLIKSLIRENIQNVKDPKGKVGALQQRTILENTNFIAQLSKLNINTLILHGAEDKVILPEAAAQLARHISQSELIIFNEVGHLLLAECPQKLYDTVLQFILRHDNIEL
jgi:pimeloyl-ACP methyl ester carboxylesterase